MRTRVETINVRADARGFVFEPSEKTASNSRMSAHAVISEPGAIRGNHYHSNSTEIITVVGAALVRLKEDETVYDIEVPAKEVYRFTIPPNVTHAVKNTGDQPNILVAFNTVEHDLDKPDQVYAKLM